MLGRRVAGINSRGPFAGPKKELGQKGRKACRGEALVGRQVNGCSTALTQGRIAWVCLLIRVSFLVLEGNQTETHNLGEFPERHPQTRIELSIVLVAG